MAKKLSPVAAAFSPPHFKNPTSADLLRVLAGCESGTTEPLLNAMGFASEMLVALHDAEHIDGYVEHFANPKGLSVNRYSITVKGRMVLEAHDGRK